MESTSLEVSPSWIAPWVIVQKMTQWVADTSLSGFRPYLGAAFGGFIFATLRRTFNFFWEVVSRRVLTSLEIPSKDETFGCVTQWLNDHEYSRNCSQLTVETVYDSQDDDREAKLLFTPSYGEHWLTYKGKWIWLNRTQDGAVDIAMGGKAESIKLTAFVHNKGIFRELLNDAMELNKKREQGKLVIHTCAHGFWKKFGLPEVPRPLSSVILKEGLKEEIINDVEHFRKNSQWYRSLGIPYRRGYMLYGPPGCGKSSFIRSLAGHLGVSVCLLNLNNPEIKDDVFNSLLNETPRNSLIVIEDIDAAMPNRDDPNSSAAHGGGLTLSGLLNALDGIASQEGRLLFMTTNKKERLDPALIRPGRIDRHFYFGLSEKSQARELFLNFFPSASSKLADQFAQEVPDQKFSMAELQKFFMNCHHNPSEAAAEVHNIADVINEDPNRFCQQDSESADSTTSNGPIDPVR